MEEYDGEKESFQENNDTNWLKNMTQSSLHAQAGVFLFLRRFEAEIFL